MQVDTKSITSPDDMDRILCSEIDRLSEQEDDSWNSTKRNPREFAHSLFQYPAMMVPLVQKKVIELILKANPEISTMLDPYAGAGTTFTAAMSCGLDCYGQDINPLAILVSKAKTDFGWKDQELIDASNQVVLEANADNSTDVNVSFTNMNKWFRPDVSIALSKIRRAILKQEDIRLRRILWVTFAETIRLTSNDRTTTYKLHARPLDEIKKRKLMPIKVFEDLTKHNTDDIISFKSSLEKASYLKDNLYTGQVVLSLGDSTLTIPSFGDKGGCNFQLLVTSPPYGDNTSTITYGQHAYLPLQWIDLSDIDQNANISILRTTQEIDRKSLGGSVPKKLDALINQLSPQSKSLAQVFDGLKKSEQPKDRAARVASFYQDFILALDRILISLEDNSYLVWTVGNRRVGGEEIPNDRILAELLNSRGMVSVTEINRSIHFKRMPHKNKITKMMGAEKIMIFRKIRKEE
jgi:hypothetical protein